MNLGIVLVSGGLDSCVTAAIAAKHSELAFLHLNYRQRTEARELVAFTAIGNINIIHNIINFFIYFSK